ncbi:23421_t:CDS:2, partial [Racocetra persica]
MLRPSVDAEDKQLYYRCCACSYKHLAEKDECLVRFREVKPPSKKDQIRSNLDTLYCRLYEVSNQGGGRGSTRKDFNKDEFECKTIQRPSRLIKAMISNKDVFESMENIDENIDLEQETDLVSQNQEENTAGWD